ncbi:hypothetical protein AAVH_42261 [Aphelenchoides avenae]|nr:hypothetical protein AAVH_42261 [Aphelenchus avenae]
MLPCSRRATRASSSPTSNRLVAACIVSFVLVTVCSWCAAQEVVDITPEDITQYYPVRTAEDDDGLKYTLNTQKEPVTVLLRTQPNSSFEVKIMFYDQKCGRADGDVVLTNGWDPDCQLRFECKPTDKYRRTWTVYEKSGSELSVLLVVTSSYVFLKKQTDGTVIQDRGGKSIQLVKDCVLVTKSFGDHPVYNLTFANAFLIWVSRILHFGHPPLQF